MPSPLGSLDRGEANAELICSQCGGDSFISSASDLIGGSCSGRSSVKCHEGQDYEAGFYRNATRWIVVSRFEW